MVRGEVQRGPGQLQNLSRILSHKGVNLLDTGQAGQKPKHASDKHLPLLPAGPNQVLANLQQKGHQLLTPLDQNLLIPALGFNDRLDVVAEGFEGDRLEGAEGRIVEGLVVQDEKQRGGQRWVACEQVPDAGLLGQRAQQVG